MTETTRAVYESDSRIDEKSGNTEDDATKHELTLRNNTKKITVQMQ